MDVQIINNHDRQRFEAKVSGSLVHLDYVLGDGALRLVHTEVPAALEGRGLGSKIVRFALDFAKVQGLQVIPQCPFVKSFIDRHPDYEDLL